METDYPLAYEKAMKIIDALTPLCEKLDKPLRRLSKAEQDWLLHTTMRYVRLDVKSSELIELDSRIIHALDMEIEDLKFENDKLKTQLEEMRHYA